MRESKWFSGSRDCDKEIKFKHGDITVGKERILYFSCSWIAPNSVGAPFLPWNCFYREIKRGWWCRDCQGKEEDFFISHFWHARGREEEGGRLGCHGRQETLKERKEEEGYVSSFLGKASPPMTEPPRPPSFLPSFFLGATEAGGKERETKTMKTWIRSFQDDDDAEEFPLPASTVCLLLGLEI